MKFYSFHIGDFYALTNSLDHEGQWIVFTLINHLMATEKPIDNEWLTIGFPVGMRSKVESVLKTLFSQNEQGYFLPDYLEQIEKYQNRCKNNKLNASKRKSVQAKTPKTENNPTNSDNYSDNTNGKPVVENNESLTSGKQMDNESLTNGNRIEVVTIKPYNHITIDNKENNTKESSESFEKTKKLTFAIPKPSDVTESTWNDFIKLRRAKKAPITETVLKGFRRESEKAGVTLEAAIALSVVNGWTGTNAEWINKKLNKLSTNTRPPIDDFSNREYGHGVVSLGGNHS